VISLLDQKVVQVLKFEKGVYIAADEEKVVVASANEVNRTET
jgi:hypothetical protein